MSEINEQSFDDSFFNESYFKSFSKYSEKSKKFFDKR